MHTIRLRGPWRFRRESTASADGETSLAEGKIKLPADWASVATAPTEAFEFERSFHKPTGIENEVVHLVVTSLPSATVSLNGIVLGDTPDDGETTRFSISAALQPRNELQVRVSLTAEHPCPGEVSLEIGAPIDASQPSTE